MRANARNRSRRSLKHLGHGAFPLMRCNVGADTDCALLQEFAPLVLGHSSPDSKGFLEFNRVQ